jgi:tRNA/rRNA methyltransferase
MARLRIVLVEPQEAGNVGAAARAMLNFGFDDLRIAGEMPAEKRPALWWSSGAESLVEGAVIVPSLLEAIADAKITVATTSARGRDTGPVLDPAGVAALAATLGEDGVLAIVFGREDRGLTTGELALCQRRATIPTSPRLPTMNLAQSVAVFCLALASAEGPAPAGEERPLAPAAMVERLHERARALLLDAGYLDAAAPDHIYRELRELAGRSGLTEREVTLLLGAIRQLEWKIGSSGGRQ